MSVTCKRSLLKLGTDSAVAGSDSIKVGGVDISATKFLFLLHSRLDKAISRGLVARKNETPQTTSGQVIFAVKWEVVLSLWACELIDSEDVSVLKQGNVCCIPVEIVEDGEFLVSVKIASAKQRDFIAISEK